MQLPELREYAERRDLAIVGEYIDRMTGSKDSRPSLNRLMADAGRRKFDAVLVWKLDRFGRSLRHLVKFVFLQTSCARKPAGTEMDLSDGTGKVVGPLLGARPRLRAL